MIKLKSLKRFLMVSCLSIHLAYSAEINDLARLQAEIKTVSERVRVCREAHGDVNSVIVLGRTGSGKSTLITHLADRPLVARAGVDGLLALDTEVPLPDFHIGEGIAVGTRIPTSWYDPTYNIVYWDCPGFGDPRGAEADIVNAFSIQQLFQHPSQVKIVIAAEETDLRTRAPGFGALLNQLIETFPDNSQLEHCLSLVVTRQRDVDVLGALGKIYADAEENALFRIPRVKSLVKFLRDNVATRVSCMPYPTAAGAYVSNRASILASIAPEPVLNPDFNIFIPAESRLLVGQLSERMNKEIADYIVGTVSTSIEIQILNMISRLAEKPVLERGEETGLALKTRFSTYVGTLTSVRKDNPQNYIQDLQLFLTSLGVLDSLDNLRRNISIIDFFSQKIGENLHQTSRWKDALGNVIETAGTVMSREEGIISKLYDFSKAPTERINSQYRNTREHPETNRQYGGVFGRNQRNWDVDVRQDVWEQDNTVFPGGIVILDPHTFSYREKCQTRRGERGEGPPPCISGYGWRNSYNVVWTGHEILHGVGSNG